MERHAESLGRLYELGAKIDWKGFDAPYYRKKVLLPTYPFQREHYWVNLNQPQDNWAKISMRILSFCATSNSHYLKVHSLKLK